MSLSCFIQNKFLIKGLTGIRTQVRGFKVPGDDHYTIRPFR